MDPTKRHDKKLAKMLFIFNAIEQGWTVTKNDGEYHFTKTKVRSNVSINPNF